jgi:hypothetical protein
MEYLTADDQAEFERLFPSAQAWLTRRSLHRELVVLMDELARHEKAREKHPGNFGDEKRFAWAKGRVNQLASSGVA